MKKRRWHFVKLWEKNEIGKESAVVVLPMVVWYKDNTSDQWNIFISWFFWAWIFVEDPGPLKDGWQMYNYADRNTFPPRPGKYLTSTKDKSTYRVLFWTGLSWAENDTKIGYFSEITPVPKKPF